MAELVNRHLESTIPELEEYHKNNIFSSDEIRMISKKRRMFEYRCQRRIVKKADFLHYIQFELHVDQLRSTRCKLRRITGAVATQNYAIVQRIHRLFHSVLLKFKGDLKLWLKYIKFCKTKNAPKRLQQAVQDALKFHSYSEGLWILAAQCDYERDNIEGARLTMMAALRAHPKSHKVWVEYCRMELMHVDKLRRRFVVAATPGKKTRTPAEEEKLLEGEQFSCKVADRVYRAATERVGEVALHLRFLAVYHRYAFAEQSCEMVHARLASLHPDDPSAISARCQRPLDSQIVCSAAVRAEREQECDQLFQAAIETSPSLKLWEQYCLFWFSVVEHHQQKSNAQGLQNALAQVFHVCQLALECDQLSLEVGCQWLEMLLLAGFRSQAVRVADHLLSAHSENIELWVKRLELEMYQSDGQFVQLVQASKKSLAAGHHQLISEMYGRWALVNGSDLESALDL